jgi:hypothetical protein
MCTCSRNVSPSLKVTHIYLVGCDIGLVDLYFFSKKYKVIGNNIISNYYNFFSYNLYKHKDSIVINFKITKICL